MPLFGFGWSINAPTEDRPADIWLDLKTGKRYDADTWTFDDGATSMLPLWMSVPNETDDSGAVIPPDSESIQLLDSWLADEANVSELFGFELAFNPSEPNLDQDPIVQETADGASEAATDSAGATIDSSIVATDAQATDVLVLDENGETDVLLMMPPPMNMPPGAQNDNYSVLHDQTLVISAPGVLANDADPDNGPQPITASLVSGPTNGALNPTLAANGSFTYVPNVHFVGTDTFKYKAFDGAAYSMAATVTITVGNTAPGAAADSYVAIYNTMLTVAAPGVRVNDVDQEGDAMTSLLVTDVTNGLLVLSTNGSFWYAPNQNFLGLDSFTYRNFDGFAFGAAATVSLNVVQPTVNILTDSNNSGGIEGADDEIEMDDPGKILWYNNDDDNGNALSDRSDPSPFVDGNGNPVNDDELRPINLYWNTAGADLNGFTLRLLTSSLNVQLWSTLDRQPLQTLYTLGTDTIPATIFAEGFDHGTAFVDWLLRNPAGIEIHRDSVLLTVIELNMRAYRPQTEGPGYGSPFARTEVPWQQESEVGIRRNGDDDNGNSVPDRLEAPVIDENDTIEVELTSNPAAPAGVEFWLVRQSMNLEAWNTSQKGGPVLTGVTGQAMVNLGSYWVDWVDAAPLGPAILTLQVRATNSGNVALFDDVTFVPFTSVVIVLGGQGQVPADPVLDPSHGVFEIAINEYRNGYDVHMYDEDDVEVTSGAGAPYDEIVNAIQNRGVTQVAIFGYSHGGGATYEIAERLELNPGGLITLPFSVPFTSYIDGVTLYTAFPENRRPPLSDFHTNQYETNSVFPDPQGGPSGGDDDIDRSALGVDHYTIDDHSAVTTLVRARLAQKVTK